MITMQVRETSHRLTMRISGANDQQMMRLNERVEIAYPQYDGPSEITPTVERQTLQTGGKTVMDNIVVKAVPQYGGRTDITPSEQQQTLQTRGTMLERDIVINAIPIRITQNLVTKIVTIS